MRVSEVMSKKNQKVTLRVPPRLRSKMGGNAEYKGTVVKLVPRKHVFMVKVKTRFGEFDFRPQDVGLV